MTQATNKLYNHQDLFIQGYTSSIFATGAFKNVQGEKSLFNGRGTIGGLFELTGNFFYINRLRLTFKISDAFQSNIGLIKGLIEFNRTRGLSFSFNHIDKTIEIDILSKHQEALESFLERIHQLILQELEFKQHLKRVLAFEEKYGEEKALLYAGFVNSFKTTH